MAMYRFHRVGFAAARVADVPAQRQVRHARADESRRTQTASTLHYQPKGDTPIIHLQKKKGRKTMRNMLKATTLERKFPLLAVENGCIISKDADITVAFRVELPELFTVTSAEYEA